MPPAKAEPSSEEVLRRFPALAAVPTPALEQALATAQLRTVPDGTALFEPGSPCRGFPLVLSGTVRVTKASPEGREVLLYTVKPGESCLLSSGCLLGGLDHQAYGIAKGDVRLLVLPPATFNRLVSESKPFRDYVFSLFSERLAALMELVEAVTFQRLDRRLAALLLARGTPVRMTQQNLADEIGSVREIIGRLLRSFEEHGWVSLGRERIEILDEPALRAIAQS
jgi:CRP/FNR family transcriptional regulator